MSNVERLRQAGIELDEAAQQKIESLSEDEMAALLALYAREPETEILPDDKGWGNQHRNFLDLN